MTEDAPWTDYERSRLPDREPHPLEEDGQPEGAR